MNIMALDLEMNQKFCPGCHSDKPQKDFSKNPGRGDGLGSYCKPCGKERYKKTELNY